jgi:hypothetical protein
MSALLQVQERKIYRKTTKVKRNPIDDKPTKIIINLSKEKKNFSSPFCSLRLIVKIVELIMVMNNDNEEKNLIFYR